MKFNVEALSTSMEVPQHFAPLITQEQWVFIQNKATEIEEYLKKNNRPLPRWIIANWFITYCLNQTKEGFDYMKKEFAVEKLPFTALDEIEILETLRREK